MASRLVQSGRGSVDLMSTKREMVVKVYVPPVAALVICMKCVGGQVLVVSVAVTAVCVLHNKPAPYVFFRHGLLSFAARLNNRLEFCDIISRICFFFFFFFLKILSGTRRKSAKESERIDR